MNLVVLYLLLLKATVTSFSGLTSLPVLREDLVVRRGVLTDRELNAAVATVQMAPGPNGLYVMSVGYFVAGWPGALCGWLATVTPAFLILPMLRYAGRRAEAPRVRSAVNAVTIAAAGLIVSSAVPLARQAISGPGAAAIAAAACVVATFTRVDTVWVILGAAAAGLGLGWLGW